MQALGSVARCRYLRHGAGHHLLGGFGDMIAIQAGRILTPLESIVPGVILIEGKTIMAVGHPGEEPFPAGTPVIDFQDKVLRLQL